MNQSFWHQQSFEIGQLEVSPRWVYFSSFVLNNSFWDGVLIKYLYKNRKPLSKQKNEDFIKLNKKTKQTTKKPQTQINFKTEVRRDGIKKNKMALDDPQWNILFQAQWASPAYGLYSGFLPDPQAQLELTRAFTSKNAKFWTSSKN